MLLARTVGLGEAIILALIIGVVVIAGLFAFRNRTHTDGDA